MTETFNHYGTLNEVVRRWRSANDALERGEIDTKTAWFRASIIGGGPISDQDIEEATAEAVRIAPLIEAEKTENKEHPVAALMTSNLPSDKPEPTLDDMLEAAETLLRTPQPIGELHGAVVYLNHLDRTLTLAGQTVSVDHQFLLGTKIRHAALQALGEK